MAERMEDSGLHIVGPPVVGFFPDAEREATKASWLTVRPDGRVLAYAGKVEYGQGIRTGFAAEVADELRVAIDAVDVVLGDTDLVPWDMGTFGSQSTAQVGLQLRKAAATARNALVRMAATRLRLPSRALVASRGAVVSRSDASRAITYAELIQGRRIVRSINDGVTLTPASDFTVMGRRHQRTDAVACVTGQATYSQDIVVEGMLYASILQRPSLGARLASLDRSVAECMPGVARVVRDGYLVAVLADTDDHAAAACRMLRAEWEERRDQPSQVDLPDLLVRTGRRASLTQEAGSLRQGFKSASGILQATYFLPYITHAPLEPRAAVAQWQGDRLTVWAGTQQPFAIRSELADRFNLDEEEVRVIVPGIGGAFGSKNPYPIAVDAARLARIAGRPVRVAYTRAEDMTHTTVRPAALITVRSGFKSDGSVVAWQVDAHHATSELYISERGAETPYDVPHVRVTTYASNSPLPSGTFRSLGGAVNHFARESHMDEIAAAVGLDPVELRLRNLSDQRFRRVLESAVDRHGWISGPQPSQRGTGVALGLDADTYDATCVDVVVDGADVRVKRVTVAFDCGLAVDPDGVISQVEGSVVMGIGAALFEEVDFRGGRILNDGLARYRVPRTTDAPAIDVELVGDSGEPSSGAGEPAFVPMAAAIANAVFDRTGQRHRQLPIRRYLR
jgi:isoquinoline 1-oxidoreductase